jgi:hypothetical protein
MYRVVLTDGVEGRMGCKDLPACNGRGRRRGAARKTHPETIRGRTREFG